VLTHLSLVSFFFILFFLVTYFLPFFVPFYAKQALQLGPRLDEQAWHGSRPTLPDSRPMIGACPGQPGMWLAMGHQHIGFSTGPATGQLLADLMLGQRPAMDMQPFDPARFA